MGVGVGRSRLVVVVVVVVVAVFVMMCDGGCKGVTSSIESDKNKKTRRQEEREEPMMLYCIQFSFIWSDSIAK